MVTKTNERELASKISEWINEIIKRNDFPFTSTFNGTYQIKISKDDKMIKQIIARYKQKLKERLEQNAHKKLHDWHLSEKMVKEILGEWIW